MKDWKKEPRFMLDEDSICYGCDYYKHRNDVIFDHSEDEFDENDGCCDVPHLCANGSENFY